MTIWLIWPHTSKRTLAPGVIKFTILADPSFASLLYTYFVWSMYGSTQDFERNNAFWLYDLYGHTLAQEPLLRGSWLPFELGVMKFTISSLLTLCNIPNLVKIGSIVFEKKMLTDDAQRRTPTHSPNDSADLKIYSFL